jgi:hypothetical protein
MGEQIESVFSTNAHVHFGVDLMSGIFGGYLYITRCAGVLAGHPLV